jgi:hypothetical protein
MEVKGSMSEVLAEVMTELGDHLDALDRYGAEYARRYVEHVFDGGPMPHESRLHPLLSRLVREVVLDQDVVVRRRPRVAA